MNASFIKLYGTRFVARQLRRFGTILLNRAEQVESYRSLTAEQRQVLARNEQFRDKHKGRRAFVIVNGPSLAGQNLDQLKDEITFVVSGFWKHSCLSVWQPTYYSLLDKNYFTTSEHVQTFYRNLHEKVTDSTFFVPLFRGYDAIQKHGMLPRERAFYVAAVGPPSERNNLSEVVQSFAGVSAFALAQAVYMGCNPIHLLGFDHDHLANRGLDRHFYAGGTLAGSHEIHIPLADRVAYDDEMRASLALWANYRSLKKAATHQGIEILNATDGGYLDVFKRCDYRSLSLAQSMSSPTAERPPESAVDR